MENRENESKYPNNSYRGNVQTRSLRSEEPKKKDHADPVAQGKIRKKTFKETIVDNFMMTTKEDVLDAVINDWMIPGVKNIFEHVIHMMLFGDKPDPRIIRSRGESRYNSEPVRRYWNSEKKNEETVYRPSNRQPEIEFPTREKAESVMIEMREEFGRYHKVSVKYLYELSSLKTDWAMSNWGWRDLTGMEVTKGKDGFILKLPKVEALV